MELISTIIETLKDKDHKKGYELAKDICVKSASSDEYYKYLDDFAALLTDGNSYVRTRGFQICCAQARWDEEGKLAGAFRQMAALLHDEKPTVVRQCLAALHEVAVFRPELCPQIAEELATLDVSQYKDSMAPLIKKDIDELMELVE